METIEYFSDFLRKIGAPNFLAVAIVILVLWLLLSGLRKGLKKENQDKNNQNKNNQNKNNQEKGDED